MPNRKRPSEDRIITFLSFKVPIEIHFSIATTETLANAMINDINNLNIKSSIVCRELLLEDLGIKKEDDEREDSWKSNLNYYFSDEIKAMRNKIYKDLKIDMKKPFGTDYMVKRLLKFIADNKNKLNVCKSEGFINKMKVSK